MGYHLGRALPWKVGASDDSGLNVRTPIAGSVYLLNSEYIPTNDAAQSRHSWVTLVNPICHIKRILATIRGAEEVHWLKEIDVDLYNGLRIKSQVMRGWGLADSVKPRKGELVVKDYAGTTHRLKIIAHHQCPKPDDSYTLVFSEADLDFVQRVNVQCTRSDEKGKKASIISDIGSVLFDDSIMERVLLPALLVDDIGSASFPFDGRDRKIADRKPFFQRFDVILSQNTTRRVV
ncbi:uncharacterized protein ARMOST_06069 [Armillaria ostoyae]|uniref:Uncharacterized protein n=1 Tax=Armillaria ostoyae TaxID=47428 RepID=A0A284R1Y5_ARMOS|nr:uncharacterized protein ARMOST_06069 [Armillaria ostoyae]